MKNGVVTIKGTRDGLLVSIDDKAGISLLKAMLQEKLQIAGNFFNGARVTVDMGSRVPEAEEIQQLKSMICNEFGMELVKILPQQADSVQTCGNTKMTGKTIIIKRTIRSGQKVRFNGNVVVIGDVNPGAEIIASKDILIMGVLRGVAHAGAEGDTTAIVAAYRLQPTQLRIGDKISRAPDGEPVVPESPEVARVCDEMICIQPYTAFSMEQH